MFRKFLSIFLIGSILLILNGLVFAQADNDWKRVENLVGQEVAVKTRQGMKYGIIKSVDTNGLVLQTAGKKSLTQNELIINRSDVKKLWRALLFVNGRKIGKGALIGAGIGVGVGTVYLTSDAAKGDGQAGIVPVALALYGAGIGGAIGFFAKKKHKKQNLIYKN